MNGARDAWWYVVVIGAILSLSLEMRRTCDDWRYLWRKWQEEKLANLWRRWREEKCGESSRWRYFDGRQDGLRIAKLSPSRPQFWLESEIGGESDEGASPKPSKIRCTSASADAGRSGSSCNNNAPKPYDCMYCKPQLFIQINDNRLIIDWSYLRWSVLNDQRG